MVEKEGEMSDLLSFVQKKAEGGRGATSQGWKRPDDARERVAGVRLRLDCFRRFASLSQGERGRYSSAG